MAGLVARVRKKWLVAFEQIVAAAVDQEKVIDVLITSAGQFARL